MTIADGISGKSVPTPIEGEICYWSGATEAASNRPLKPLWRRKAVHGIWILVAGAFTAALYAFSSAIPPENMARAIGGVIVVVSALITLAVAAAWFDFSSTREREGPQHVLITDRRFVIRNEFSGMTRTFAPGTLEIIEARAAGGAYDFRLGYHDRDEVVGVDLAGVTDGPLVASLLSQHYLKRSEK